MNDINIFMFIYLLFLFINDLNTNIMKYFHFLNKFSYIFYNIYFYFFNIAHIEALYYGKFLFKNKLLFKI